MSLDSTAYSFGDLTLHAPKGSRLDVLLSELKEEFPALVMQRKKDHWFWFWSPDHFTVVVGMAGWSVCAFGEAVWLDIQELVPGWDDRLWTTLCHERRHLRRFKRLGLLLVGLLYALVFFPVGLAWGRAWLEREGYLETLRCWYALDPARARTSAARDWWVQRFTGPSYGWMWPFKGQVRRWYDEEMERLEKPA